jgi:Uma2 family endonuclease
MEGAGGDTLMTVKAKHPRLSPAPRDSGPHARRWTRAEYHRAAELGLFGPEERLELLDGEILKKMTQNAPHVYAVRQTTRLLDAVFSPGSHARAQAPIVLNDQSEPEPDVAVVTGDDVEYLAGHPTASDALLVVEVADTTLRLDRVLKGPAYARAGIREYWIVNLRDRQLEVYRDPARSRYRTTIVYGADEGVTPLAAPHATVRVADLLPPVVGDEQA